jgi:hypothetical protein
MQQLDMQRETHLAKSGEEASKSSAMEPNGSAVAE